MKYYGDQTEEILQKIVADQDLQKKLFYMLSLHNPSGSSGTGESGTQSSGAFG